MPPALSSRHEKPQGQNCSSSPARGIGYRRGVGPLFAAEGARLALVDQDKVGLGQVAATSRLRAAAPSSSPPTSAAISSARRRGPGDGNGAASDVLLTAAGMSTGGTIDAIEEAAWDRTFAVNVKGTYLWIHDPADDRGQGGRHRHHRLAACAVQPCRNAAYIATKGAIASLTKTVAVDHAAQGIRVNALTPGVIDTPMPARTLQRYADPDAMKAYWKQRHPMGRIGQPEEVARAALFLAGHSILRHGHPAVRRRRLDGALHAQEADPEQIAGYERDGYVCPVDGFSPERVRGWRERLEDFERRDGRRFGKGHNFKPHLLFPWVDALVRHPAVLDPVEDLIGPDIRLFHFTVWPKSPGDPAYVSWHQDATYFGLEPAVHITAWVALTDAPVEAGWHERCRARTGWASCRTPRCRIRRICCRAARPWRAKSIAPGRPSQAGLIDAAAAGGMRFIAGRRIAEPRGRAAAPGSAPPRRGHRRSRHRRTRRP